MNYTAALDPVSVAGRLFRCPRPALPSLNRPVHPPLAISPGTFCKSLVRFPRSWSRIQKPPHLFQCLRLSPPVHPVYTLFFASGPAPEFNRCFQIFGGAPFLTIFFLFQSQPFSHAVSLGPAAPILTVPGPSQAHVAVFLLSPYCVFPFLFGTPVLC